MVPPVQTNRLQASVDNERKRCQLPEHRPLKGESKALRGFQIVLAALVVLCLALAVLVWSQLLRAFP